MASNVVKNRTSEADADQEERFIDIQVQSFTGQSFETTLSSTAVVHELAALVRAEFGTPISRQRLLHGDKVITELEVQLKYVFEDQSSVQLSCVFNPLTDEEQAEIDMRFVRAVAAGQEDTATELLLEGAQTDAADVCGGISPLTAAVVSDNEPLAKWLRNCGAPELSMDPRCTDIATSFRQRDLVDVARWLHAGADPNVRLRRGDGVQGSSSGGPLHACCALHKCGGAYELVQLLLKKRADPEMGDTEGDNCLAHAKYFSAKEIFELLKDSGVPMKGPAYGRFGN